MPKLNLDHIVLAVPNLDEAILFFQKSLGVTPIMGGRHRGLGTYNALFGIGAPQAKQYIELLAIDPKDFHSYPHYSMGLSREMHQTFLASWCLRCEEDTNIHAISEVLLEKYSQGAVKSMQRQKPTGEILSWQIVIDQEKILLSQGQAPFFIKWDNPLQHPATELNAKNFCDYKLELLGPDIESLKQALQAAGFEIPANISFTKATTSQTYLSLTKAERSCSFAGKSS